MPPKIPRVESTPEHQSEETINGLTSLSAVDDPTRKKEQTESGDVTSRLKTPPLKKIDLKPQIFPAAAKRVSCPSVNAKTPKKNQGQK
jgi:hypothetical protein